MSTNNISYDTKASELFDKMQQIIEDRKTPLLQSYQKDFYKLDRDNISKSFAENTRYLWLVHNSGTHMGRVGVLPDEKEWMQAVLNTYGKPDRPESVEIYSISINANCDAKLKQLSLGEARRFMEKKDYTIDGQNLKKGHENISYLSLELTRDNGFESSGTIQINTNGERNLSREELVANSMISAHLVEKKTGSLFSRAKNIFVNGKDIDTLLPILKMGEVTVGKYLPEREAPRSAPEGVCPKGQNKVAAKKEVKPQKTSGMSM